MEGIVWQTWTTEGSQIPTLSSTWILVLLLPEDEEDDDMGAVAAILFAFEIGWLSKVTVDWKYDDVNERDACVWRD